MSMAITASKSARFAPLVSLGLALVVVAVPLAAQAQRRSPLEDAPAIRKRVELRETRFEAGVGFGSTVGQDFYHTMMLDLRLGFHLNDWLSIAAFGGFGVANIATGFESNLVGSLPTANPTVPREPTQAVAKDSMEKITAVLGAQLEFTPFTGKYSLFGKVFAHYDFYAFGGVGALDVKPTDGSVPACAAPTVSAMPPTSCSESGLKPAANFGIGLHSYFNDWLALNIELRDLLARLNPSGRDVNGDGAANSDDQTWTSTYVVTANIMFFLPGRAAISQ
jgi:outer membrane beta-barrel protein